jgi:hypothetical protein
MEGAAEAARGVPKQVAIASAGMTHDTTRNGEGGREIMGRKLPDVPALIN